MTSEIFKTVILYKTDDHVKKLKESIASDSPSLQRKADTTFKTHKIYFRNNAKDLIAFYRYILCSKGEKPSQATMIDRLTEVQSASSKVLIILHAGGYFCAAIYQNGECIRHKTHRAYIVRQKGGGIQGLADARQSAHKSMGAQLRRQNQAHFEEKITALLKLWNEEGDLDCTLKFVHVPYYAKRLYFNEDLLEKDDPTIRSIPFSTVRPGLSEANRVFTELFSFSIWKGRGEEVTQELVLEESKSKKAIFKEKITKEAEEDAEENLPLPSISQEGGLAIIILKKFKKMTSTIKK